MQEEFRCLVWGSPAVEYPSVLTVDAHVRCQRCKAIIATLGEFRRQVRADGTEIETSTDRVRSETPVACCLGDPFT